MTSKNFAALRLRVKFFNAKTPRFFEFPLRLGVKSYQRHKSHLYRKDAKIFLKLPLRLRALALKIFLT
jgi:hypothetical protein